jgi:hypothetical protein
MKCASATAGIASVMTGLVVVLSGAPAHATFIYLNPSSVVSASSVAPFLSGSAAMDRQRGQVHEDLVPGATQRKDSDAAQAHGEMVFAGLQQQAAGVYENDGDGSDAGSDYNASYSAPFGFRWSNSRNAVRANGALPWYLSDATVAATGSSSVISPAKDSSGGSGGVSAPSIPAVTAPVANTGSPTPPSLPNEAGLPPLHTLPIGPLPPVEAPIVGVPSKTVPEPSTVGLLGIGLLLIFAIARGKRARYYSQVSGSPRSSRRLGSLARSLNRTA